MRWLELPPELVRVYAAQIPAVQAREALLAVATGQVAAGTAKPGAARRAVSRWRRDADRSRKPADLARVRAAGIRVEHRTARRR